MKARGMCDSVTGCGRNPGRLEFAITHGIADTVTHDPSDAALGADLVVICTPVGLIPSVIEKISPRMKHGAIVTDVGSTKQFIVEQAEKLLPANVHFVGSHPMAGSESAGVEASTLTLFENAICVVTPSGKTEVQALERIQSLWESLKCRVMVMSPEEHDTLVAASSHLPHLAAVSLCQTISSLSADNEKVIPLLAGGFRDTTRIASGSPEVWRDICIANRDHIVDMLASNIDTLCGIKDIVESGDDKKLESLFRSAAMFRDEVPSRGIGALTSNFELLVDVADRPGVLGELTSALGHASINIKNINIQHVRELGGGTMLLVLEKEEDIESAIAVLGENGFSAKRK